MAGVTLAEQDCHTMPELTYCSVKKPVFPFNKFPDVDPILGPEMRSTGEVMGVGIDFGYAFSRAQLAVGQEMPRTGVAFLSVRDADKPGLVKVAALLKNIGFSLIATRGTAVFLKLAHIECDIVNKVTEGRPHIVDRIKNNDISFIVNTTEGEQTVKDSSTIRSSAILKDVCYTTTLSGGMAACLAMQLEAKTDVLSLQSLYK